MAPGIGTQDILTKYGTLVVSSCLGVGQNMIVSSVKYLLGSSILTEQDHTIPSPSHSTIKLPHLSL
jgi:hypothetical protein